MCRARPLILVWSPPPKKKKRDEAQGMRDRGVVSRDRGCLCPPLRKAGTAAGDGPPTADDTLGTPTYTPTHLKMIPMTC